MSQQNSTRVGRSVFTATRWAAIGCGYALTGLAFLVTFEVVTRKLFNMSIQGADEIGGYVLAVTTALGFSIALITGGHTRIDIFVRGLGRGPRRWLDLLSITVLTVFSLFMTYNGYIVLSESIAYRSRAASPLETPLWIPQSMWLLGLGLFSCVCAYTLARAAVRAVTKDDREDVV